MRSPQPRLVLFTLALHSAAAIAQLINYVDPFIGTEGIVPGTGYNGGNIFPGAAMPFGMVKIGPDLTSAVSTSFISINFESE